MYKEHINFEGYWDKEETAISSLSQYLLCGDIKAKEKLAITPRCGVLKVTSDTVGEVILISKNWDKKQ